MPLTEHRAMHAYGAGEEVVVRLDTGGVVEVVAGDLALVALPEWTIGEITAQELMNGVLHYTLTFAWAEATYKCTVPESAIEGTA